MKAPVLSAVLACLIAAPAFAQGDAGGERPDLPEHAVFGEPASPEDAEAVGALMRDFSIAWGSGDAEGAASAYADDVEWTNAFGEVIRGSEALERKFEQLFTDFDADASEGEKTNYQPVSMRFVGSNVAIVHGVTTSRRGRGVDGSDERRVHLTFVMAKQSGEWRIVHQVIMDART